MTIDLARWHARRLFLLGLQFDGAFLTRHFDHFVQHAGDGVRRLQALIMICRPRPGSVVPLMLYCGSSGLARTTLLCVENEL